MKIAIIGAGFTGLTAALRLSQKGHQIQVFEKDKSAGGLAIGFRKKGWNWSLEKAYHHWFTNDYEILNLASELNHKVIVKKPTTKVLINNTSITLDSAKSLLTFSYLPIFDRIRVGLVLVYLKVLNNFSILESKYALRWLKLWMGKKATKIIWEPLFSSKFGKYKDKIALVWFWARIKKRTASLAYPEGGFLKFAENLSRKVRKEGGRVRFNCEVQSVKSKNGKILIGLNDKTTFFDKVIITSPTPVFIKICKDLPKKYSKKIGSIPHLHALSLVLVSKKPLLEDIYWLNINNKKFPFLVIVEHTNFMDSKHYNNQKIIYIGNYLPLNHPFLEMTEKELLNHFMPYLIKLNANFRKNVIKSYKFIGQFAQPVVKPGYLKLKPSFQTPIENVYLANLDMVYPWDRGTNYAVKLGEDVAKLIN